MSALAIFIAWPALALVPATAFFALYRHARRRFLLVVSVAWLVYALYEYGMKQRVLCSGECNIRVDLLLIYPALLLASVAAIFGYLRSRWRSQD